ncbi:MAG: magnesium chelatase [Flavobacteriales bacterium]|nr:magnesium chelatase [Flavobacteriales bacterium]
MKKELLKIKTLGGLKAAGYTSKTVKEEMRVNLISRIRSKEPVFEGILGYEDTVIPQIERAILSKHNMILLGLRGQAKTRIARLMVQLLDEYIPVIQGSDLNEDPLNPISSWAKEMISELGDKTPISWWHKGDRYTEKLATPDVSVADLIGDVDPIKAANLKLDYSDEKVIHFGLIPRSHRGLFVINELPDLQPRLQVALFNMLQEGDIQIRGFKIRMDLDTQFIFTANPEDYTNRGAIITPLKDRIESQIITHYPKDIETSKKITQQEASLSHEQRSSISVHPLIEDLIEQIAFEARESEYIDQKSGVSARLTISAYENLVSAVERRMLRNNEEQGYARIGDLYYVVPAITGKVELLYEGEQEGATHIAQHLIGKAIRTMFPTYFPDPEIFKKRKEMDNIYRPIVDFFSANETELLSDIPVEEYDQTLNTIPGLNAVIKKYIPKADKEAKLLFMEFILHGLTEYSILSKNVMDTGLSFNDLFSAVFSSGSEDEDYNDPSLYN